MKKALICFSFLMLLTSSLTAEGKLISPQSLSACVLNFPQSIVISQDMRDLNFSKSQTVDAFWDYEATQPGSGFSYQYQNAFCFAKVHISSNNQSRLTNTKVQRMLKDKTLFPVQKQKNLKINKTKFYGVYGKDEDISNTLLYGDYKEHFLKIRTSCVLRPRLSSEKYEQTIDEMTTIFAESIVDSLDRCIQ